MTSVRILDIAAEAGVSRSLVSKVLSGRMGTSTVRPELASRIRSIAQARGFVPNAAARSLHSGRQDAVAVFLSRHGTEGSALLERFLDGASRELSRTGRRMGLQFFHDEDEFRRECLPLAFRARVDGVLVGGMPYFDIAPALLEVAGRGLPVATVFGDPVAPEIPNAGVSQEAVGEVAARHLLSRGCRRPLALTSPGFSARIGERRLAGFRAAMEAAGAPVPDERVIAIRRTYAPKADALARIVAAARRREIDAVFCESDRGAALVLNALAGAGVRVPGRVKVLGVDDSPFCTFAAVPLSSVSTREKERAAAGVRQLDEAIGGGAPDSLLQRPAIVARESTRA